MKNIIIFIVIIIIAILLGYIAWRIGRIINYNLSYKDMVIETIHENVKKECLK